MTSPHESQELLTRATGPDIKADLDLPLLDEDSRLAVANPPELIPAEQSNEHPSGFTAPGSASSHLEDGKRS